ncbi:MAG: prepilin-type N-terminal cleavage/methylation domain-containing protein [Planctomycetota bacterium]|jgi:prepilin-type N-terminal cleavage/methylation domain-containing protein
MSPQHEDFCDRSARTPRLTWRRVHCRSTLDRGLPSRHSSVGFTLIEIMIAMTIMGLIVMNVSLVMKTSKSATDAGIRLAQLDNQASFTMNRIANAIMASSSDGITPAPEAPDSEKYLDYKRNVGIVDGVITWGEDERISLEDDSGQIVWIENVDEPEERRVVWSNWVSEFLEGELENGSDDNLNGLFDENGLSFDMNGRKVTVRLTLRQEDQHGQEYNKTLVTRVTARN